MTTHSVGDHPDIIRIEIDHPPDPAITAAIVGGKAWGLLRMVSAGMAVPPAFVLGTACCREYFANNNHLSENMKEQILHHVRLLEKSTNKSFGSKRNPLLVSVRSGAPVSMPGMMETLLNIGLNDETVSGLVRATGNPRLAWDSYRRLIQDYARVVYSADTSGFEDIVKTWLKRDGLKSINEFNSVSLRNLCGEFKFAFHNCTGKEFPQDPWKQLHRAVRSVFDSWFSERANKYRTMNHIDPETGTACMIQSMVFGNAAGLSGSGVGFTRNPANGNNELYVDYLANAQGEDIVSGRYDIHDVESLQQTFPTVFEQLNRIKPQLENEFLDMQDFEFTVQEGELFLLQTRDGKRTPMAALKIAIDMFDEKLINATQALTQLKEIDTEHLYLYQFSEPPKTLPAAKGTTASNGIAAGMIVLDEKMAKEFSENGKPVVLVRTETSTEDIGAMHLANAVITVTGGRTSHAAVIARQLGIPCVVGCQTIRVNMDNRRLEINEQTFNEGDYLTVDADHGYIYKGEMKIELHKPETLLKRIREWLPEKTARNKTVSSPDNASIPSK